MPSHFHLSKQALRRIAPNNHSVTSIIAPIDALFEAGMRTTINLDDELLAKAKEMSGLDDRGQLIREALRALIERESIERLIRLGGTEPTLADIPRRRDTP